MGKLTFRRTVNTHRRMLLTSYCPITGGVLFFFGSTCFWPGLGRDAVNAGAVCFLTGSFFYWAAPVLDFWELVHNHRNLLEPPPDLSVNLDPGREGEGALRVAATYEHLYKSHILRIQCANCLVYTLGGGFFVAGSTLFFPAMEEIIYHGGWLYITGCVLMLGGALLAMLTAFEMRRTAIPMRFVSPPPRYLLPFWNDEHATVVSCSLYLIGNFMFIIGSVFFFPKVIQAGGVTIEILAVLLFVGGSALLTVGGIVDYVVIVRAPRRLRPSNAPQIRGLSVRPTGTNPGRGLGAKATRGGPKRQAATPPRRYLPMVSELSMSPVASRTPPQGSMDSSNSSPAGRSEFY